MSKREEYEREGFVVVQSGVSEALLDEVKEGRGPAQPEVYHYNKEGHRWFESWKTSQATRDVVYARAITNAIVDITSRTPRPFQTILFDKGSSQPLHHDAVHFDTRPHGRLIGVSLALEDIDERNGPLRVVPGSHRAAPFRGWQKMGMRKCEVGEQEGEYRRYERLMEKASPWAEPVLCRKGDAVIFSIDLIHGGAEVVDRERTRWSLVSHYFLGGEPEVEFAFAPMFGTPNAPFRKRGLWFDRAGHQHPLERNRARV